MTFERKSNSGGDLNRQSNLNDLRNDEVVLENDRKEKRNDRSKSNTRRSIALNLTYRRYEGRGESVIGKSEEYTSLADPGITDEE